MGWPWAPAAGGELAPAAGAREAPSQGEPLRRKLAWLTLFRLVMMTVLLGGTALTDFPWAGSLAGYPALLYWLILGTYGASLAFALALRARWRLELVAYLQVALDVGLATVVVALTGGAESVFLFLFLLAVVNGSILLFRRGALVGAALAMGSYTPVALLGLGLSRPAAAPVVLVHLAAFGATAALAGYLAEQLRWTDARLVAREGALAAITALHESIVQSVTSGIVTVDAGGRITFLNRAGETITGLQAAAVLGQPAARWFGALQAGQGRDEADLTNARGERLRLGYHVFALLGGSGAPLGSAIIFQDLTHLRAMEEAVQRSERLADLGRLAAGLAHELRNPLAAMSGSVELLRSAAVRPEDQRLMDIVLREAGRLEALVAAFLDFSRPAPPRRERVALDRVLADTLEVFAHDPAAARVRLERALAPAEAWCDPDQLRQVIWNLLANAAQAGAGTVHVRCGPAGDGAVALEVADDGPGIAPADLAQIFTPFFTTRERGTGLGLATVHRIVDAHGGGVRVDSTPGQGARFRVTLPAAGAAAAR